MKIRSRKTVPRMAYLTKVFKFKERCYRKNNNMWDNSICPPRNPDLYLFDIFKGQLKNTNTNAVVSEWRVLWFCTGSNKFLLFGNSSVDQTLFFKQKTFKETEGKLKNIMLTSFRCPIHR